MDTPNLIGIAANVRFSGKSTLAGLYQAEYGYVVQKFASPLKAAWAAMCMDQGMDYPTIEATLEGDLKESELHPMGGMSFRTYAEVVGTRAVRNMIHKDTWMRMARHRFKTKLDAGLKLVVDDLRFWNEAELIRDLGGKLIQVIRPGYEPNPDRPSEGQLQDFPMDVVIYNDRNLDFLLYQGRSVLNKLTR